MLDYFLIGLLIIGCATVVWLWRRAEAAWREARAAALARAEAVAGRAAAEQACQQNARHLACLGEASLDALLLIDADRQIVWGNAAAWEMFGAMPAAVGQPFIGLVHDYELNQAVLDAISGGRAIMRQAVVNGRIFRIRAVPAAATGGAAAAIEDVTELQRLGRARRDFVANLSHELRTPLANIDLAAQTLQDGGTRDPALTERMLNQIQTQVQALSQLSQEMMDLAQIESGQVLLKLVPAPIAPLVQKALAAMLPQAKHKSQHISLVLPGSLQALMDEQQIARVIGNLLHNAVKFTPEGGIISVSAEVVEDDIRLCVSDTGPGVPRDERARIFERFYKHDRARSKGGTGLGLAIARHIVEGHGGRIWVEGAPGEGARFYFTLPKA
jgi:two-component system phosphate regulon sensor histidine kinase PhoR